MEEYKENVRREIRHWIDVTCGETSEDFRIRDLIFLNRDLVNEEFSEGMTIFSHCMISPFVSWSFVLWLLSEFPEIDVDKDVYGYHPILRITTPYPPNRSDKENETIRHIARNKTFNLLRFINHPKNLYEVYDEDLTLILAEYRISDASALKKSMEGIMGKLYEKFKGDTILRTLELYHRDPLGYQRELRKKLNLEDLSPAHSANIYCIITLMNDNLLRIKQV